MLNIYKIIEKDIKWYTSDCFSYCQKCIYECNQIQNIEILPKIVYIGYNCFYGYDNLKTIHLNNVKILGHDCFRNCKSLSLISLPFSMVLPESVCIYNCSKLESIILNENVNIIHSCFDCCPSF